MAEWKCDRCGADLETKEDFNVVETDSWKPREKKSYYLCHKCFGWFHAFMDGTYVENEADTYDDISDESDLDYFE